MKIIKAVPAHIDDLITYRAMPTSQIEHIDPFLFLNHHGPQTYAPNNNGLPFGPHPHRGFETVTFIIDGDVAHKDSGGGESVIKTGGIQWMTAGSGLLHAEVSSDQFLREGGKEEILQLWVNLPAVHKMTKPNYIGLQAEDIPHIYKDDAKVDIHLISGTWGNEKAKIQSLGNINLSRIDLKETGTLKIDIPATDNIFFYVVRGTLKVNERKAGFRELVHFAEGTSSITVEATEDSIILFGHATPFNEPIVAHGPFVMNSQQEIMEAFNDFRSGKMGTWDS